MELRDLKQSWNEAYAQTGNIEMINLPLIDKMKQKRYRSGINSVLYPEVIGTVVCLAAAVYLIANFGQLNSVALRILGVFSLAFMLIMPAASLLLLAQLYKITDVKQPFSDILRIFTINRIRFLKFQRFSAFSSYAFLVAIIFLLPALFPGKNIPQFQNFWLYALPLGYLFLFFFSKWVLKKYNHSLHQSEELLKELNS